MPLNPDVLDALRRKSHLTLSRDGAWRFHDTDVAHPRVQALFHLGLEVDQARQEVLLHVGKLWCYVKCETVARFVDGIRFSSDGRVRLRLRHGMSWESSRFPPLAYGTDGRFYAWLALDEAATVTWAEGGRPKLTPSSLVAVCSRAVHQQLAGRLFESAEGHGLELRQGGRAWPVVQLASRVDPWSGPPRGLSVDSAENRSTP